MKRTFLLLWMPFLLAAADWTTFRSGPFEVLSEAGAGPGREAMNTLEQLRYTFGQVLGQQDLEPIWPVRVMVFDSARSAAGHRLGLVERKRDAWVTGIVEGQPLPLRRIAQVLMEANITRMPREVERSLLDVFSTLRADNTIITLGAPPPPEKRDKAWARVHMLTVSPLYASRARVFFSNLQQGADWYAAHHNAFGKKPEELDAEVERYMAAGSYPTRELSGAPINPKRDFQPRDLPLDHIETALADLMDGEDATAAYNAVLRQYGEFPGAYEGLGQYEEAVRAGSRSAACLLEFGRQQKSPVKAQGAYAQAAKLNPRWAEPYIRMTEIDSNRGLKIQHLNKATELEPRNVAYWRMLAEAYLEGDNFDEAGRAWTGAFNAADEAEREQLIAARTDVERTRSEHQAEQRRKEIEERDREIQRLKDELNASIRAAEQQANADAPEAPKDRVVVEWWDDPRPKQTIWGQLVKVDCLNGVARLNIKGTDDQITLVVVRDPSQIVIMGGGSGEQTLGCGVQDPVRSVAVVYFAEPDDKLKSIGDASVIEFR